MLVKNLFFAGAYTIGKPEIVETLKKLNFLVDNFIRRCEVLWFKLAGYQKNDDKATLELRIDVN